MGNRRHGCGDCGGRGCGGCGWSGFGYPGFGYPGFGYSPFAGAGSFAGVPAGMHMMPNGQMMADSQMMVPVSNGMALSNGMANGMANDMAMVPVNNGMAVAAANGLANGQVVTVQTSGPGPYGFGYGGFVQAQLEQYAALKSAAGFPIATVIAPIGFKSKKIRRHKTRTVVARPNTFFKGKGGIFIPRSVAKHFEICEIKVGGVCIPGFGCGVPAEIYSNQGCTGPLFIELPLIGPGQSIRMRVRNHSNRTRRFRAAVQGVAAV